MFSARRLLLAMTFITAGAGNLPAQLSKASIEAAQAYSAKHAGIAMIVKERSEVRYEKYYNGHSADKDLHIYSGTKSFFGVLAVIAEDEGLLKLDEKVADTIPEWRDDPRKSQITIRELLDFTSGMVTGFEEIYGRSSADKLTLSLGLKAKADRGDTFVYGPSHLQVFCEVLRRKLKSRGTNYRAYLDRKLIRPLDITITQWRTDEHGNAIPSAGMWMTGRDWMHFGEMVCDGGSWNGKQLVRTDSLSSCFRGTKINPAFGLCFWVNSYSTQADAREVDVEVFLDREPMPEDWSGACLSKNAPPDLVCSLGSNFQRLYIVPSMDLVVVHLGKKGNEFRDAEFLKLLFAGASREAPAGTTSERKVRPLFPKGFGLFKRPEE